MKIFFMNWFEIFWGVRVMGLNNKLQINLTWIDNKLCVENEKS